uniref:Zinc finger piccolo-type domain-containing protein n=1 Tax=Gouania willdenowi TaxID=441366 RepID=A0A8C5EAG9_GOUWI
MQRALGIDMTTPRSKSQQQIHSPSHQAKPIVQPQQPTPQPTQPATGAQPKHLAQSQQQQQQQQQQQPYSQSQPFTQAQPYSQPHHYPQSQHSYPQSQPASHTQPQVSPGLQKHPGPGSHQSQTAAAQQGMRSDSYSQRSAGGPGGVTGGPVQQGGPRIPHPGAVPLPGLAKAPSQPDLGRGSPMHQPMARHHDQTKSAGSSPAHRPQSQATPAQDGLTKLFGFGASLLNQASTLINVDPLPSASTQPSPARGKVVFSNAGTDNRQQQQQATTKPFGMGGTHTQSQMGGPHTPGQTGGPHATEQMRGPHAPGQMGGPHVTGQMGGPHAPGQMGGPHATGQMGGTHATGQMGGPHAPGQMGGPHAPGQMGGPHAPGQMGGPHAPGQLGGPHAPGQMGGPHASGQMGGPHATGQMGSPYPTGQMGSTSQMSSSQTPGQIGGPLGGQHTLAQKQQQQTMPNKQETMQQQFPIHHQKELQEQQKQPQGPQQQPPAQQQKGPQKQEPVAAPEPLRPKVNCPLCKTELNIGSSDPANYNTCTQCHSQVCNLCGFNPTPHLVEKKEWLCLNCQTQRLMSGGGLDDSPLPVPHPSPKHQPMGSPRHQTPTNQQSPLHKPTSQQGPKAAQPQKTQAGTAVGGPMAAKQPADTKTAIPAAGPDQSTDNQKQPKSTEDKPKTEPENQTAKDTKSSLKKGEQITPIKEIKKSKHYDVSLIFKKHFKCLSYVLDIYIPVTCSQGR